MSNYLKKFSTLFTGVVLSQVLSVIFIPILSRLYSPAQFGELALFVSITGVLALFAGLKLQEAIMLAKNDKEISKLVGALIYIHGIFLGIFVILSVVIILFEFYGHLNYELNNFSLILLPFNIILFSLFTISGIYFTKMSAYKDVSKVQVTRSMFLNLTQLLSSNIPVFNGLVLGNVIGNLISSKYLVQRIRNHVRYCKWDNCKYVIKKYSHFPKFNLPQALFNNMSSNLPNFILVFAFGTTNIGLFYMVLKLLNLPTTLISNVVTNLYYQDISNMNNSNKKLSGYYYKTILILIAIITPFLIVLLLNIDVIIAILGEDWASTKKIIPAVALWTASIFIYMPATKTLIVLSLQKYFMIYTVTEFFIKGIILIYGSVYLTFETTIRYFSQFNFISNIIIVVIVGFILYFYDKRKD